jgi:hypothetical protein
MYTGYFGYPYDESMPYDADNSYELETYDLPLYCPYRQMVPPPGFPQGPQGTQGGPPSAPPSFTPQEAQAQQFGAETYAIDSGAIKRCVYRFVYIWPRRGNGFWAWLTFVGRRSIAGFRWERNRWVYFGMDLRDIRSFQCF